VVSIGPKTQLGKMKVKEKLTDMQFMSMVNRLDVSLSIFVCLFWWGWGLKFWFAMQTLYHLNHTSRPCLLWLFWKWKLENYLMELASN
jgi:hypothetical protein